MIQNAFVDLAMGGKSVTALVGILLTDYLKAKGIAVPEAEVSQLIFYVLGVVGIVHKVAKRAKGAK